MKKDEKKTIATILSAYLIPFTVKDVHLIIVIEYLAERNANDILPLYVALDLIVGYNTNGVSSEEKREAYECDITYGTNNEFGFDYLRDNMVLYKEQMVQRPLNFAIIDEVDSVLIDEARTPLIISGSAEKSANLYEQANTFVKTLNKDEDFTYDEKSKGVQLIESGINKAENFFKIDNLFD